MNHKMHAANARASALKKLIDAHLDEWEELHATEREKRGLTRTRTVGALADENRRLRDRLAALEADNNQT